MAKKKQIGHDLLPIHLSHDEVKYFNYLQGGQSVDPETGLREYSPLEPVMQIPEIRNLFIQFTDFVHHKKKMPKEVKNLLGDLKNPDPTNGYFEPIPSDSDPEVQKLASLADNRKDILVVLMPSDIVNFLDILRGTVKRDPIANLEEFGWFDEIVRGVATVGGAILGGPIGAGIGNFAGKVATGADPMTNILPAAKIGLATWGAGKAAGALGSHFPGLAASAPGVFGSGATWGATPGFLSGAGSAASAATPGAASAASETNPNSWGKLLGENSQWLVPGALIGGGMLMSHKAQQKAQEQHKSIDKERREEASRLRQRLGMDVPLNPNLLAKGVGGRQKYAKGDLIGRPIVGKGKGQEDKVNDDRVKEGGWIWDASTVANWGDGSTKAGHEEIKNLEKHINKAVKPIGGVKKFQRLDHGGTPEKVPCALSDGERYTPPEVVTAAGHGSNERGAAKFRLMTKILRAHKIAKGTELPPAAPAIVEVFKKVG